jgi:transcription elongation factor GreA
MVAETEFLTPEGYQKLKDELRHLIDVRRPEVAELIREAKEAGDISENAAYDEAKEQQAFLEARIRHIEDVLKRAEVIEQPNGTDAVSIGCTVTVAEEGEGPESFRLVGSAEADPTQGFISIESPLGRALIGKRVGDSARIKTPDGSSLTFQVLDIA